MTVNPTKVIYGKKVNVKIGLREDGLSQIKVRSLAGKKYVLEKYGIGVLLISEYKILHEGGFILNAFNAKKGDIFVAHIFTYNV